MSTKKKVGISDLLRDEVQKETETPAKNDSTEQTIEVKAETIAEPVSKASISPELNAEQNLQVWTIAQKQKFLI